MWTDKEYEIKYVICPRCNAYMLNKKIYTSKSGLIITYVCDCGYTLDLVSRTQNKKDKR